MSGVRMTGTETDTLRELASDVAAALSDKWTTKPTLYGDGIMLHCDGGTLRMSWVWPGTERVSISGDYPGDYGTHSRLDKTRITAATSRGAEAIARDISRRVLPAYWRNLATVTERIAKQELQEAAIAASVARLAEVPGVKSPEEGDEAVYFQHPGWLDAGSPRPSGLYHGKVSVNHAGAEATLSIDGVPIDAAVRILRILLEDRA